MLHWLVWTVLLVGQSWIRLNLHILLCICITYGVAMYLSFLSYFSKIVKWIQQLQKRLFNLIMHLFSITLSLLFIHGKNTMWEDRRSYAVLSQIPTWMCKSYILQRSGLFKYRETVLKSKYSRFSDRDHNRDDHLHI